MFSRVWLRDVGERTLATFLQAFLGLFIVAEKIDISTSEAAWTAGLVSAFAVVKGALASLVGDKDSASADPAMHAVLVDDGVVDTGDHGHTTDGVVWTIVGILAIIALVIWIASAV